MGPDRDADQRTGVDGLRHKFIRPGGPPPLSGACGTFAGDGRAYRFRVLRRVVRPVVRVRGRNRQTVARETPSTLPNSEALIPLAAMTVGMAVPMSPLVSSPSARVRAVSAYFGIVIPSLAMRR